MFFPSLELILQWVPRYHSRFKMLYDRITPFITSYTRVSHLPKVEFCNTIDDYINSSLSPIIPEFAYYQGLIVIYPRLHCDIEYSEDPFINYVSKYIGSEIEFDIDSLSYEHYLYKVQAAIGFASAIVNSISLDEYECLRKQFDLEFFDYLLMEHIIECAQLNIKNAIQSYRSFAIYYKYTNK